MVEAHFLTDLDQLFGPYLRGDVPVYRGTSTATLMITSPTGALAYPEQMLSPGPVLAALYVRPAIPQDWVSPPPGQTAVSGNDAVLVVHGLAQNSYTVFDQSDADPITTATDGISDGYTENLLVGSCSSCAPNLFDLAPSIAFELSSVGSDAGNTYSYSASANLAVALPCSLTFADLAILNGAIGPEEWSSDLGLNDFVLSGGDWVRHITGIWTVKAASPVEGVCDGEQFNYTIDEYVENADLGNYGVRNYAPGPIEPQCGLGPA